MALVGRGAVDPRWSSDAGCQRADPQLFFPEDWPVGPGGTGAARNRLAEARRVCQDCPVRQACLDFAVAGDVRYGVWGGLTADERRGLRRSAPAGR